MKKLALASVAVVALSFTGQTFARGAAYPTPSHNHHTHAFNEFPPQDARGNIMYHPEYYMGDKGFPYMMMGGYWWYPMMESNMMEGYVPFFFDEQYWYPSMQHPHMVYMTGEPVAFVYPHPMDGPMDDAIGSPMEMMPMNAPRVKP